MLSSKKKAIIYEFVVDLLIQGIINHKSPYNKIKKSVIKKICGEYLTNHGVYEFFTPLHLSTMFTECKIIYPLLPLGEEATQSQANQDRSVYHFCGDRLLDLLKRFSRVGKFFSLKDLIDNKDQKSSELFVNYCNTFSISVRDDKPSKSNHCVICELSFDTPTDYEDHMDFHVENNIPSNGRMILPSFKLAVVKITPKDIMFEIANILEVSQNISRIILISPSFENIDISKTSGPILLEEGEIEELRVPRKVFQNIFEVIGIWKIVIKFLRKDIDNGTAVYDLMSFESKECMKILEEDEIEEDEELKIFKTPQYFPTFEMKSLFKRNFNLPSNASKMESMLYEKLNDYMNADKATRLHPGNFVEVMSHSLQIEELEMDKEMAKHSKSGQRLSYSGDEVYMLDFKNAPEMRPGVVPYDRICLIPQRQYEASKKPNSNVRKIFGSILLIDSEGILVRITGNQIDPFEEYHVSFQANRGNFRGEAHALYLLKDLPRLLRILFPTKTPTPRTLPANKEPIWFNKCVANNAEQKCAVNHIVAGTAYPYPYIIYGPPGTGKTMTVVEAVCQLWKQQPNSHILITAQSNGACDEICLRLLNFLPRCDILRMLSMMKDLHKLDPKLLKVANARNGRIFYPSLKALYPYRVVICTISVAGKLVMARINPRHFTHVFIDESSCLTESQTIVPIVGIVDKNNIHGQVILSGDHKQLGPFLNSLYSKDRDYHISTMERLIKSPIYQKHTETSEYNPNLVTKLLHNYRSCAPIIDVPNIMFYDNELIPEANCHWALKWKFLPNKLLPIVVDPVWGVCQRDPDTTSYYNCDEINAVVTIVEEILSNGINSRKIAQSELGIIAPYRKQMMKIQDMCANRGWNDVDVATVELFQGKEKEVIVLSTVRSNGKSLGFLSDPKRLNVVLTRAKALFIIVGDPTALMNDKHWKVVMHLYAKYGLCGQISRNISFARNLGDDVNIITKKMNRITL